MIFSESVGSGASLSATKLDCRAHETDTRLYNECKVGCFLLSRRIAILRDFAFRPARRKGLIPTIAPSHHRRRGCPRIGATDACVYLIMYARARDLYPRNLATDEIAPRRARRIDSLRPLFADSATSLLLNELSSMRRTGAIRCGDAKKYILLHNFQVTENQSCKIRGGGFLRRNFFAKYCISEK